MGPCVKYLRGSMSSCGIYVSNFKESMSCTPQIEIAYRWYMIFLKFIKNPKNEIQRKKITFIHKEFVNYEESISYRSFKILNQKNSYVPT